MSIGALSRLFCTFCAALTAMVALPLYAQECPTFPDIGVTITLNSELKNTVPGVPIAFSAVLKNERGPAFFDGNLFVRVLDSEENTVDEFLVGDIIEIAPGASATTTFVWRVPLLVKEGNYRISATLVAPRSPFVAPGAGNKNSGDLSVYVAGGVKGLVHFDTSAPLSPDGTYDNKSGVLHFGSDKKTMRVVAQVVNDSNEPYKGAVLWRIYPRGFSPLSPAQEPERTVIELHPHTSGQVSLDVPVSAGKSQYVEAALENADHVRGFIVADEACAPSLISNIPRAISDAFKWIALILAALIVVGVFLKVRMKMHESNPKP